MKEQREDPSGHQNNVRMSNNKPKSFMLLEKEGNNIK